MLNGMERTRLRGEAHHLKPIVIVGENGISEGLILAVHEALCQHELIKVRMHDPEDKHAAAEQMAAEAHAVLLGLRGHTVILYRPFLKI
ncbi:YhbY family RNA-binding protein [Myxococcota bacterium]|nr:YhbY family RNA-binding protein [Myxococcota bacterium]MBU1410843.1 YhbY family RNA-binding protein [Myxococcota bacterium]MBU1509274.1 YhbY family RNA-binding protein [Myxococcota bacterium]PKN25864.1 MAG: ribosome assembly RNA-binding protein YhbY [Deltaproteobacteria bacterium HGW-Deltaproteobacteria-22]